MFVTCVSLMQSIIRGRATSYLETPAAPPEEVMFTLVIGYELIPDSRSTQVEKFCLGSLSRTVRQRGLDVGVEWAGAAFSTAIPYYSW